MKNHRGESTGNISTPEEVAPIVAEILGMKMFGARELMKLFGPDGIHREFAERVFKGMGELGYLERTGMAGLTLNTIQRDLFTDTRSGSLGLLPAQPKIVETVISGWGPWKKENKRLRLARVGENTEYDEVVDNLHNAIQKTKDALSDQDERFEQITQWVTKKLENKTAAEVLVFVERKPQILNPDTAIAILKNFNPEDLPNDSDLVKLLDFLLSHPQSGNDTYAFLLRYVGKTKKPLQTLIQSGKDE